MNNQEALLVTIQVAHLRANPKYREAELMRRRLGPNGAQLMAKSKHDSDEYAAVRLLIGTWNRISIYADEFNQRQLNKFFRCHPIGLTWKVLEPGISVIRTDKTAPEPVGPGYGKALEELAGKYNRWTKSANGKDYRSEEQQAICADFG
jgi:hypothetical protein